MLEHRFFNKLLRRRALGIVDVNVLYHSLAGLATPNGRFFWGGHLSEMPTSRQHGFVRHYGPGLQRPAMRLYQLWCPSRRSPADLLLSSFTIGQAYCLLEGLLNEYRTIAGGRKCSVRQTW